MLTLNETTYIVIERFDRLPPLRGSAFVRRVHQEDMCQALGLMPGAKYQQDGGPGVPDIVALIRRAGSDPDADVYRFIDANAFNWLIGGTDAHAKNYSLLIGAGDEIRLSPLKDRRATQHHRNAAAKLGEVRSEHKPRGNDRARWNMGFEL